MALHDGEEAKPPGAEEAAWSQVSALEWSAADRSFRATVDGDSVHGSAILTAEGPDSLAGIGCVVHLPKEAQC